MNPVGSITRAKSVLGLVKRSTYIEPLNFGDLSNTQEKAPSPPKLLQNCEAHHLGKPITTGLITLDGNNTPNFH